MISKSAIRVVQLSDTHFLEDDAEPEGGFAYDTAAAFDAVFDHAGAAAGADLVVVTGDIADHGRVAQYHRAARAFERFEAPVNVCPGNHDQDVTFTLGMGRPRIGTSRVIEAGDWCFLFVDSNAGVMVPDGVGRHIDPPDPDARLHRNGSLGSREQAWIRAMCDATSAPHIFIWVHHPPAAPVGLTADAAYDAEWAELLPKLPKVRGLGGGHTHVPGDHVFGDHAVFVSPALKNNFDLGARTFLPPGYRTYEFASDGAITSDTRLVDDDRWPRSPMPRSVVALLTGELSTSEFNEIVARRQAANAQR